MKLARAAVRSDTYFTVMRPGNSLQYADKELMYDMEIIFASFESNPKGLKWLHKWTEFKINEKIIRELRKKFGEKLIKKHLSVDEKDLRYCPEDTERYINLIQLREIMKR